MLLIRIRLVKDHQNVSPPVGGILRQPDRVAIPEYRRIREGDYGLPAAKIDRCNQLSKHDVNSLSE